MKFTSLAIAFAAIGAQAVKIETLLEAEGIVDEHGNEIHEIAQVQAE